MPKYSGPAWDSPEPTCARGTYAADTASRPPARSSPKEPNCGGEVLVPVGTVAAQLGVAPSVGGCWRRWGFVSSEQKTALDPGWIRLTAQDRARPDETLAAQGYSRWRLREAQRQLGLSEEDLYQRVRSGKVIAHRSNIGDHGERRVSPTDSAQPDVSLQPVGLHAESQEA
ncbi:MAG: hypothetical protein ACR2PL_15080 [Dehalococcoidia bacterium]